MADISPLIVIEFNGTTARICRSIYKTGQRRVTACFSFELADSEEKTIQSFRREMKTRHLKAERVYLVLPRYMAMAKLLILPSQDEEEIDAMVALRMAREEGWGKEKDFIYNYKIFSRDKEGQVLVSVFLVQRSPLMKYVRLLGAAGLLPSRVTLNTQGLLGLSAFVSVKESEEGAKGVVFLNADQNTMDFNIVLNHHSIFSRTFSISKKDSPEFASHLAKEVKLSFELCRRMSHDYFQFDNKFYLTGLTKELELIDWQECLRRPIEKIDLTKSLRSSSFLKDILAHAPVSYASVLGLALKGNNDDGIDLTPPELKTQLKLIRRRRFIFKGLTAATLALLAFSFFLCFGIEQKIELTREAKRDLLKWTQVEKTLKNIRMSNFIEEKVLKDRWVFLLWDELYQERTVPVSLTDLEIEKDGGAVLQGSCSSAPDLFLFLQGLQRSHFFKNCRLDTMEEKKRQSDEKIRFKIFCQAKT